VSNCHFARSIALAAKASYSTVTYFVDRHRRTFKARAHENTLVLARTSLVRANLWPQGSPSTEPKRKPSPMMKR